MCLCVLDRLILAIDFLISFRSKVSYHQFVSFTIFHFKFQIFFLLSLWVFLLLNLVYLYSTFIICSFFVRFSVHSFFCPSAPVSSVVSVLSVYLDTAWSSSFCWRLLLSFSATDAGIEGFMEDYSCLSLKVYELSDGEIYKFQIEYSKILQKFVYN